MTMRRRTFDVLVSSADLLLAVVLRAAGVLLCWGHSFASSQVTTQKITFPTTSNPEFKNLPKANQVQMARYAGQPMTTGAQAEIYADYFIARHLYPIAGGKTYSRLSAESMARPKNAALAAQVRTVFRGDPLRSVPLNACGFSRMGQIALIASIVSYIGAGLMLVLSIFGFVHLRRAGPEAEVLPSVATRVSVNES
jgi:hypothetical protein